MPLDYGIFGAAKAALDKAIRPHWKWVDKVNEFKRILQGMPVEATIKAFRQRMMECIESKGDHIKHVRRGTRHTPHTNQ
jgi:hypothetical protein